MADKMIYGVIRYSKKYDDDVYACKSSTEAIYKAREDWDRLMDSEKKHERIVAVGRKIREDDIEFLVDEMGFDEEEIDLSSLTDVQAADLIYSSYDKEYWNSDEWEERDIYFKTEGGNWVKAFLDVEAALCEYESNWDEEEDGEFFDDTEVSLEVGQDKYGREWFAVAGPNQFTTTTVGCVKTWWKWYPDGMIKEVKLS